MCVPAAVAAALVVGASTAVQIVGANQAASANNRAVNEMNRVRKEEIDKAATAEINQRLREQRREQSRIEVAAGEAGLSLSSGSIEALLMDSSMQAELANDVSVANRESRKKASDAEAQANMKSKTTALGAALQIGLASGGAFLGAKGKGASG